MVETVLPFAALAIAVLLSFVPLVLAVRAPPRVSVPGVLESLDRIGADAGRFYVYVRYRYVGPDGVSRVGTVWTKDWLRTTDLPHFKTILPDSFAPGTPVTVWLHPDDPADAVIVNRVPRGAMLLAICGVLGGLVAASGLLI